ncbi:MAG: glycosyltransferase [Alphaproteobacteria bacterium]
MNKYQIELSVILVCYNQEKYIAQAIESILMQKVDFKYDIIIADDHSTDSTLNIIQEYANQYPELIKIIPKEQNLGVTKNYKRAFQSTNSKYIAILEGDDYWTSPLKLQTQFDFLELHRECSVCSHKFLLFTELYDDGHINKLSYNIKSKATRIELKTAQDLIKDNFIGNFSTCMYRKDIIDKIPQELFDMQVYDWMYNIVTAQYGLVGYINEIMSVYRQHKQGVWSGKLSKEKLKITLSLIDEYNKFLKYEYNAEFTELKTRLQVVNIKSLKSINYNMFKHILKLCIPKLLKKIYRLVVPPVFILFIKFLKQKNY